MIITSNNSSLVHTFVTGLSQEFSIKDLGNLYYFLCIKVQTNKKGLFLG